MASDDTVTDHEPIEEEHVVNEQVRGFGFDIKARKTDLTLLVEGKRLYVNRALLEYVSPAFEEMLGTKLQQGEENILQISGAVYEDFAEFLACIYPCTFHEVSFDNVHKILPLAFEYKVERVLEKCESILIQTVVEKKRDEDYLIGLMKDAEMYNMSDLKRRCFEHIIKNRKEDIETADKELLMDTDGKFSVYEELLPYLRSEACKYAFMVSAEPNDQINELSGFRNARLKTCEIKLARDFLGVKECLIAELWDDKFHVTAERYDVYSTRYCIKVCLITGSDEDELNTSYSVILRCVVKNNIPGQKDFYHKYGGRVSRKAALETYVSLTNIDKTGLGFNWNGQYAFVLHILVNKS